MKAHLLVGLVAAASPASAKGPFLQQISSTSWIFGNDIWNLTQGQIYATNLQYQGSDAVKSAPDGESNLQYTAAKIVSNTSKYIDISFSSTYGDLHWVIYPDLAGAYQYFVNKALPDISVFRTLWRLDPARFTNGYTTTKDAPLPDFSLYTNATEVQDETFQIANGSYITKYDFSNYVRERDFIGVYGDKTGSWYIHPSYEYQPGNQLSQTLTPVGKIWGPWLWYLNDGSVVDAHKRAEKERKTWPYPFIQDDSYHSRGNLKGKLILSDGRPAAGAAIFLGDTNTSTRPLVQGSNYYYTTYADASGKFSLDYVRTGEYGLYAWSNGGALGDVYTNFTTSSIRITKGKTENLRTLTWEVPQDRIRVFQIGDFDKKALGFTNGGAPRQHGLTEKSPANLTYVIGASKTSDWYYASSKLGSWDVLFNTTRPSTNATALLSVSLAGYSQSTGLTIYLNGNTTIGTINKDTQTSDPALYRSGTTSGEWRFLQYELPSSGLYNGQNALSFTVDRYTQWRGILWDSIILEWVK
ncbi:uncharacterized protein N0V89_001724 [Didymosphaeria variabile]|uniref:rhamnogalacturonan endolyase n=1 Tax=Didymosphaeria variabile TaxID=1932322 RepID=A0A9W8XRE9_9PLEO|nr:uncharacterized protein N0V89_001724 [Didymosphaeria variabile]KAJ4357149.1 hypothetical protein N0V89_001724 [Didymosphaeria variabile]